jgi:hypothetical protein
MARDDLFEAVRAQGLLIRGKDPMMVFSTMLWRMPNRFVRLGAKIGYWLTQEPCALFNYVPPPPGSEPALEPPPPYKDG